MIYIKLRGGLGNQIFQYAAARSLAESHNTKVWLDTTWLDKRSDESVVARNFELDCFSLDTQTLKLAGSLKERFEYRFAHEYNEQQIEYDPEYWRLPKHTKLTGNFQSEQYFSRYADTIRAALKWKTELESSRLSDAATKQHSVAIHFRRGDYVTNKAAAQLLGVLDLAYYKKAYGFIAKARPLGSTLIFSDDIPWCKKQVRFLKNPIFVEGALSGPEEMQLMSQCTHHILANSSFSWWGAWLGTDASQIVCAPKKWFADKTVNSADIIPSRWKTL